jgi:multidrug resistance efflux pump
MENRPLPPIPTPPAQRWREVRLVYLPRVMFVLGIALVAWMWGGAVAPATMVAEAEVAGADLRAGQPGVLTELKVAMNQKVRAGDVLATVAPANPRLLDATLAVIKAEVAMLMAADSKRIAVEFERLQLDWISERVNRAAMLGELQQVEADLARAEPLHRTGLMTDDAYTQLKLKLSTLKAQATERNKIIDRLDPTARNTGSADPQRAALSGESALAAAIKVQEARLQLAEEQLRPVTLVAPMDGVVSMVLRRAGENVVAGEILLRVIAPGPARLVGYLRQPLPFAPTAGMKAEIRTRGLPVKVATTTVTQVGSALEMISPTVIAAMRLPPALAPETALRVEFAMPAGLYLLPGEHVDVLVK